MDSRNNKRRLMPAPLSVVALCIGLLACAGPSVKTHENSRANSEHGLAKDEVILFEQIYDGSFSSTNHVDFGAWIKEGLPTYETVTVRAVPSGWDVVVVDKKRSTKIAIGRTMVVVEIEGKAKSVEIVTVQSSGGDPELAGAASRSVAQFLLTSPRFRAGKAKRLEPVNPVWDHPPKFEWIQKPPPR